MTALRYLFTTEFTDGTVSQTRELEDGAAINAALQESWPGWANGTNLRVVLEIVPAVVIEAKAEG